MPELEDWEKLDRLDREENHKLLRRVLHLVSEGYYNTTIRDRLLQILRIAAPEDVRIGLISRMPEKDRTGVHEEWMCEALDLFVSSELRRLENRGLQLLRKREASHA